MSLLISLWLGRRAIPVEMWVGFEQQFELSHLINPHSVICGTVDPARFGERNNEAFGVERVAFRHDPLIVARLTVLVDVDEVFVNFGVGVVLLHFDCSGKCGGDAKTLTHTHPH